MASQNDSTAQQREVGGNSVNQDFSDLIDRLTDADKKLSREFANGRVGVKTHQVRSRSLRQNRAKLKLLAPASPWEAAL